MEGALIKCCYYIHVPYTLRDTFAFISRKMLMNAEKSIAYLKNLSPNNVGFFFLTILLEYFKNINNCV